MLRRKIEGAAGFSPRGSTLLYKQAGIRDLSGLEEAVSSGTLLRIPGIKEKSVENIKNGIRLLRSSLERMPLPDAESLAEEIQKKFPPGALSVAGSLRRRKETIGDIDLLYAGGKGNAAFIEKFRTAIRGAKVTALGATKVSLRIPPGGIQVDLRAVKKSGYGAAMIYFTGSQAFNVKLRHLAKERGYKLNEYGLYNAAGRKIAGRSEKEVFRSLKMAFLPPELREDRGEIELALKSRVPVLLEQWMIKGDLHTHSRWSDGDATIEEMADAAAALGYSYIAVTDHSQSLRIARGLTAADLAKKRKEIEKINSSRKDIRVFFGAEVDIGPRGELDYDDAILGEFDIVVGAVHTGFSRGEKQLTERMVKACRNRRVHIIAHPTGRLRGTRDPYRIDLKEVFKAAAGTNTCLEINAYPRRMDLNDIDCRMAAENGVRLAVDTDAHHPGQLSNIKYGVDIARRGRLGPKDVVNTLTAEKLLKTLKK